MSSTRQPRLPRRHAARRLAQMSVGQLLAVTIGLLLVLAVVGIGLALVANARETHNRNLLLNDIGPARRTSLALETALVNQETGVRAYVLTEDPRSLQPYRSGLLAERRAFAELRAAEPTVGPRLAVDLARARAGVRAWSAAFVEPALADPGLTARLARNSGLDGKRQFDALRTDLARLEGFLQTKDLQARSGLQSAAAALQLLLVLAAVLILGGVLVAGLLLRLTITRPLSRLGAEARRVAGGAFARPLVIAAGPREIAEVGAEIDAMRQRIVDELATAERARGELQAQALELTRSNAELEQFAYVASHDLQEPLRKIASFCQALKTRYEGQLDERADQYIEFATDGAKRMQVLINDLLAFSRVGRDDSEQQLVELGDVLAAAESALAGALQRAGAHISADALPTVRGDRGQLASLFQNLISNAVKFRGEEPLQVRIQTRRGEHDWELSVADNGIGIEAEYAERIFLIFQRLHSRESYEGTGIGLALCRKIVEYHGGRIWLDAAHDGGACFRFTLPIVEEMQ